VGTKRSRPDFNKIVDFRINELGTITWGQKHPDFFPFVRVGDLRPGYLEFSVGTENQRRNSMRAHKRLLISLAALAAAGLTGCLTATDPVSSLSVPVSEAEIQAALAGDSLHPVPPPRPVVCDTLKARLALLDSTAPQFGRLSFAVSHVCAVRPPRPDSVRPDSLRPRPTLPDSLLPRPPKPDSLGPVPPLNRDSLEGKSEHGVRPLPPPPPVKPDSTVAPIAPPSPPKGNPGKGSSSKGKGPAVEIQPEVDG
jgi:hypothetical protein